MLGILHMLFSDILPSVHTIHYHILVTQLPSSNSSPFAMNGNDSTHDIMSATTIVSVDLTGPFTHA